MDGWLSFAHKSEVKVEAILLSVLCVSCAFPVCFLYVSCTALQWLRVVDKFLMSKRELVPSSFRYDTHLSCVISDRATGKPFIHG